MHDETTLLAALAQLGIAHEKIPHAAVFTVEESEALHHAIPGVHTKNLFLKDKTGRFWLVTVEAHARVDLKALPARSAPPRSRSARPGIWSGCSACRPAR